MATSPEALAHVVASSAAAGLARAAKPSTVRATKADRETSYSRRPTKKLSVGQECRAPPYQLLAHKRLRRAGLGSMSKARFAQRFLEHRLPRSRDNGRCSPVLYGREGAAQHEGSPSCDRSEWPSSVASNGCHR